MKTHRIIFIAMLVNFLGSYLLITPTTSLFALEKVNNTSSNTKDTSQTNGSLKASLFSDNYDEEELSTDSQSYSEFTNIKNTKLKIKFFQNLSSTAQIKLLKYLSNEDQDWLYLFKSVNTSQQVKILKGLDKDEQYNTYKNLSNEDQAKIYENLNLTEQLNIFNNLEEAEQIILFQGLNKADQINLFKNLNISKQQNLFQGLNKSEQMNLFENLNKSEQMNIFKVLSKSEQSVFESLIQQEPPSEIESIFSGNFPKDISTELSQYGYSFFTEKSSAFEPVENIPVGNDYIIGPGDSFSVNLWGKAEQVYETTVTRDGNIIIPSVGTLNVNGLTFAELKDFLKRKLKEYYPDFEMNVTMESLRSIEVFVVGEANKPGTYSVSSLSSIISALYASGGPSKNGSLRNIQLIRNGEVLKTLDLYDFFIKGLKNETSRHPK